MSVVWSCNEWDQLEEVIVGNPLRAQFPPADPSTKVAEYPDRPLDKIPQGPFSQQIIEETEEDLNDLSRFWKIPVSSLNVPIHGHTTPNFPQLIGNLRDITIIAPVILCLL